MPASEGTRALRTLQHQRSTGKRHTYTIEANTSGSYVIKLGDKVLRTWSDPAVMARITHPSKQLEDDAVRSAVYAIEHLTGMAEE